MKYKDYIRKKKNKVEDKTNVRMGSICSILSGLGIVVVPYIISEEKEKFAWSKKLAIFFFLQVIIWLFVVSVTRADDCREKAVFSSMLCIIFGIGPKTLQEGTREAWCLLVELVFLAALLVFIISKLIKKWDDD